MSTPKNTAPAAIYFAINEIMSKVTKVGKHGHNRLQNYRFRGIEDLYNHLKPALTEAKVFCAPTVVHHESTQFTSNKGAIMFRVWLKVQHRFYAQDGSYIDVTTAGEGIDSSDKATNKAMSAAMKYAFIELFSIPTEDVADSDRDHPPSYTGQPQVV